MKIPNKKLRRLFAMPGLCELCGQPCPKREGHHLRAVGMGGNGRLDVRINMISLGGSKKTPEGFLRFWCTCHRQYHDSRRAAQRMLEIVAARERTTVDLIAEVMDFFQRLIRPSHSELCRRLSELSEPGRLLAERELREASLLQEIDAS